MENLTDENKLKSIISEEIGELQKENHKKILNEMTFPRKTYKEKIDSLIPQLLEKWCLIHYCTITGGGESKNNWRNELRVCFNTISRFLIKENDSMKSRLKVLTEIWDDNDFSNPTFLDLTIANKFIKENIGIDTTEYGKVISDCINSAQNIFDVILSRDILLIAKYVKTI